jgi:hypothetical protein
MQRPTESDCDEMKTGSRWRSVVDTTEVVIVRAPDRAESLECGGAAMVDVDTAATEQIGEVDPAHARGTLLGKRYADDRGLEVLCTKAGVGSLALSGRPLVEKDAKPLPSSD